MSNLVLKKNDKRNIFISEDTLMLHMIQKCSNIRVMEIFFKEPTTIHFIREIGRKINLAQTSVRNNIQNLLKYGLIEKKKSKPFDGFIANRGNEKFLFYKRIYNLFSLYGLRNKLMSLYPKAIVVFGSYGLGEDIEGSDIDICIISKVRKDLNLKSFEKYLGREINVIVVDSLSKLDKSIEKKVLNGVIIYGSF